jgi:hypothetical protein
MPEGYAKITEERGPRAACSSGLALARTHQCVDGLAFGRAYDNLTRYSAARDAVLVSFFGEGMARATGVIAADRHSCENQALRLTAGTWVGGGG